MKADLQEREDKRVNEAEPEKSVVKRTQPVARPLDALLEGTGESLTAAQTTILIDNVACDSRKVQAQGLFFALQGAKEDGAKFARDAVSRGAIAVVSESSAPPALPASVAWIRVP